MRASGLRWVLVDGQPAHVSWFATLPPGRRPAARCPECGGRLVLKLGDILRHHAAHDAASRCAATRHETALHSDTKLHVADQLRQMTHSKTATLSVRRRCAGSDDDEHDACDEVRVERWLDRWDDVRVERSMRHGAGPANMIRPDITLFRDGGCVGAIEVLVSHAANPAKAAVLAALEVPWVELRAHEALLDGPDAWHAGEPLPAERLGGPDVTESVWRCARHAMAHAREAERRDAARAAEFAADHRVVLLRAARVVDLYLPDGARERVIFRVEEERVVGEKLETALVLRSGGREIARATFEPGDGQSRRLAWRAVRDATAGELRRVTPAGAFSDTPMRWATNEQAENLVHEALHDMVPGDPTPLATRYPRRWFFARDARRWFLPADMRAVRWDRPAGDPFAAHPAWTRARAVRERGPSASDDGWRSFVFAARPTAAQFGAVRTVELAADGAIAILAPESPTPSEQRLVVLMRAAPDHLVRDLAARLDAAGHSHVWLSHPRDWSASRSDLCWVPAGRDGRGKCVVVVDGAGVYMAERFTRAFRDDARFSPAALRERSLERVQLLG